MNDISDQDSTDSPSPLLPHLPNDVAIQCIARVPRLSHPNLSLVSKSWHSLLLSPLLFTVRSNLNCTQQILYINIRTHTSFKWFAFDQNSRTLSPLPPIPSPSAVGSSCVVLGHRIFVLGGSVREIPSSRVWIFDGRFNKWETGPKMTVAREFSAAGVIHDKIYVIGGCVADSWVRSRSWAEVFDPIVGSWAPVPSPIEAQEKWMHGSAVIDNKLYAVADRGGVVFDPVGSPSQWGYVSTELDLGWRGRATVVDGVLYCYDYLGKIRGYDGKENRWKELMGVDKELPNFLCGASLANVGGRLFVVWEGKSKRGFEIEVSCAEVEVCKWSCGELRGFVVWSDIIMAVPSRSTILHCLAVGL